MIKKFFKKKSAKDLSVIFSATFANQVIGIVRGFFVAKFLGPRDFGILKAIQLITMLSKYGNFGFNAVAVREVCHYKGIGDLDKVEETKNVAYSSELLLSISLFLVGICSCLLFDSKFLIVAVILAAVQLLVNKIFGILNTEFLVRIVFLSVGDSYSSFFQDLRGVDGILSCYNCRYMDILEIAEL